MSEHADNVVHIMATDHNTHVTHYVGIDGRDLRVYVNFDADDHCTVKVLTVHGLDVHVTANSGKLTS